MLRALTLILTCQLIGEVTARALALPVPGPVIGMLLLLIWLVVRGGISEEVEQTADNLLGHLSLLFVPAGVGIMVHWHQVQREWLAITVALLVGTLIAMTVTAVTMTLVSHLMLWVKHRGQTDE